MWSSHWAFSLGLLAGPSHWAVLLGHLIGSYGRIWYGFMNFLLLCTLKEKERTNLCEIMMQTLSIYHRSSSSSCSFAAFTPVIGQMWSQMRAHSDPQAISDGYTAVSMITMKIRNLFNSLSTQGNPRWTLKSVISWSIGSPQSGSGMAWWDSYH